MDEDNTGRQQQGAECAPLLLLARDTHKYSIMDQGISATLHTKVISAMDQGISRDWLRALPKYNAYTKVFSRD